MARKKTVLIDFDGTISNYHGWKGEDAPLDPPIERARHAMILLAKEFRLVCFTTRPAVLVEPWLKKYGFPEMKVTNFKEPAHLLVDDRALAFRGEWTDDFLNQIRSYKTHWETNVSEQTSQSQQLPDTPSQSSPTT